MKKFLILVAIAVAATGCSNDKKADSPNKAVVSNKKDVQNLPTAQPGVDPSSPAAQVGDVAYGEEPYSDPYDPYADPYSTDARAKNKGPKCCDPHNPYGPNNPCDPDDGEGACPYSPCDNGHDGGCTDPRQARIYGKWESRVHENLGWYDTKHKKTREEYKFQSTLFFHHPRSKNELRGEVSKSHTCTFDDGGSITVEVHTPYKLHKGHQANEGYIVIEDRVSDEVYNIFSDRYCRATISPGRYNYLIEGKLLILENDHSKNAEEFTRPKNHHHHH